MNALIYQPENKWRFVTALTAAAAIHVAAITFARTQTVPPIPFEPTGDPPVIELEPVDPTPDPQPEQTDPLPTPPVLDQLFVEPATTPPPVRRPPTKFTPITAQRNTHAPSSLNMSAAKVLALNAPRPKYPYEARRQKITGDGVVVMSVDPASGGVTGVTMAKSTGSAFLDNAAIAGFRRWRFKPGSVSTVTCPVTFTLSGASY
ncbi:MAG TPA: TonB family protein [Chthoniobacterales bacterium]|nr:TonB family protein [Chthoniobacterales bacterium]